MASCGSLYGRVQDYRYVTSLCERLSCCCPRATSKKLCLSQPSLLRIHSTALPQATSACWQGRQSRSSISTIATSSPVRLFCLGALISKCCLKATSNRTFSVTFFITSHHFLHFTNSGDIGVFKDMPLKELNMRGCGYNFDTYKSKITGMSRVSVSG